MSEFTEYQKAAWKFALPSARKEAYLFTNLAGEVGEACSLLAKDMRDYTPFNKEDMQKEMGDILWMVAGICSFYGWSLHEVAVKNIQKLEDRAARNVIGGSGDAR